MLSPTSPPLSLSLSLHVIARRNVCSIQVNVDHKASKVKEAHLARMVHLVKLALQAEQEARVLEVSKVREDSLDLQGSVVRQENLVKVVDLGRMVSACGYLVFFPDIQTL